MPEPGVKLLILREDWPGHVPVLQKRQPVIRARLSGRRGKHPRSIPASSVVSFVRLYLWLALILTSACSSLAAKSSVEDAWDILTAGVDDKDVAKRSDATQALGLLINDKRAPVMAEKALDDDSPDVRVAAANALGEMQSRASIPKLREALSDKDTSVLGFPALPPERLRVTVILAAAHALLVLKDDSEYEVYYAVLTGQRKMGKGLLDDERKMLHDPKKLAGFGVETGLGTFVPFGGLGLTAWKRLTKDDSSSARAAAARVLTKDPDPQSGSALLEAISDRSWVVRVAALESLAKRGNPSVLKQIEPAMQDPKEAVQYVAAAAVIRLSQHRRARRHEKQQNSKIVPFRPGLPKS